MAKLPADKLFYQSLEVQIHSKRSSPSFVSKLFYKIKDKLFSEQKASALQGRIQELHWNSTQIREELERIKEDVDADLQPLVFEVIDPMLRSIQQLHNSTQNSHAIATVQEKTVQRYMKWIDQAKLWVQLYAKAKDKKEVLQAVIDHIVLSSNQIIERDLQILHEYQIQAIEFLDGSPEKKEALQNTLHSQISPFLDNLGKLKHMRCPLQDLKQVSAWKIKIDSLRQENFNNALHTIDAFTENQRHP